MSNILPRRIDPVPLLMRLREVVLRERDDRCPRWRFRLAPDLVVQLQPRPGERRDRWFLFAGTVLQGTPIEKGHFASWKARCGTDLVALDFGVLPSARDPVDPTPGQWLIKARVWLSNSGPELFDRLVDGLCRLDRLDDSVRFAPACLCCGRALTESGEHGPLDRAGVRRDFLARRRSDPGS